MQCWSELGNFQPALLGKIQTALTQIATCPDCGGYDSIIERLCSRAAAAGKPVATRR
jgi:hypothetical protein